MRPFEKVRGLCPRDRIRWAADITVRTVGDAVAIGHAERPQPVNRGRHATQGRARRWVCARNRRRPSTGDGGAPGTVRPTVRGERLTTNPRSPSSNARGVGDAAPYGGCVWVCFSGAVRWAELMVCDCRHPLRSMPQRSFCCQLVGRTVLGAPRLRDCRGNVGADGRRDRLHPCFLRCAR